MKIAESMGAHPVRIMGFVEGSGQHIYGTATPRYNKPERFVPQSAISVDQCFSRVDMDCDSFTTNGTSQTEHLGQNHVRAVRHLSTMRRY